MTRAWERARHIDIDWLLTFIAVAELGGFARAAQALHRSQSRVSAHIASLEDRIGAKLFDRDHRPTRLTEAGEVFLEHARAVLDRIETGTEHVAAVAAIEGGTVRVGSYASASAGFLPQVISSFAEMYPRVRVYLHELNVWELSRALTEGDVGLAIQPRSPGLPETGMSIRPLWREDIEAVVPEGHPAADAEAPVDLADLLPARVVSVGHARSLDQLRTMSLDNDATLQRAGVDLDSVIYTQHPQAVIALVRAGVGIGVANSLALEVSDRKGVNVLKLADPDAVRDVLMCWRPERFQPAAEARLLAHMLEARLPPGTRPVPPPK